MPKKFRTRWLKALRSRRYKQVDSCLQNEEGRNCCLGVAGRILRVPKDELLANVMPGALPDKESAKFPICLVKSGKSTKFANRLASMNDEHKSFKEIADYIEKTTVGI